MTTRKLKTKRGRKQDAALVSNQPHELKYEGKKKKVSVKKVRKAKSKAGRSRKKIEAELDKDK